MAWIKNLLTLYVNSSIHVALSVTSLSMLTFLETEWYPDYRLLLFIFLGSITGYNFVKYAGVAKLHHASLAGNLRLIQVFSFLCFLGFIYIALRQSVEILLISAGLGLLTLLYAVPFLRKGRNLRSLGGLKIFIIAVVWAGVSVVLPLVSRGGLGGMDELILFLQRLLFVIVLLLPFEIRDLPFDSPGLKTLPQQFGVKRTILLGQGLLLGLLAMDPLKEQWSLWNFLPMIFTVLLTALLLMRSEKTNRKFFASFWVEGIPVFWLLCWLPIRVFAQQWPF